MMARSRMRESRSASGNSRINFKLTSENETPIAGVSCSCVYPVSAPASVRGFDLNWVSSVADFWSTTGGCPTRESFWRVCVIVDDISIGVE